MIAVARWVVALAGGTVWALCFGREPWLIVPWLALLPLILQLGDRQAAALGFAHGLAFWLVSISWISDTLVLYGSLPNWLAALSLLALAAYLALFPALFAGLGASLWRRGGGSAVLGLPALWVAIEWVRGHLFSGFAWNLASYAWIGVPGALPLAAWLGAYGVSFVVVLASTGLALGIRQRDWRPAATAVGLTLLALAVAARWAVAPALSSASRDEVSVRVLQPNIGILDEWTAAAVERNYRKILDLSRSACDEPGALLVWPESAAWPYSFARDERLRRDLGALTEGACPILMNSSMSAEAGVFNSVLLLSGGGAVGRYDKRHLVPFGEYVPMARWLPFLKKIARNAGEYLAGSEVSPLDWQGERLAIAICFEVTFPEEVAEQVRQGASLLVTVTNDAWYGDTWAPWQHFRSARFRAAESHRYLLRAAITGVSAIVAPDGSVEQSLGVGEEGILAARVRGHSGLTLYSRATWLAPVSCLIVAAFAIFVSRKGRMQ